jgi:hypothetical protein
MMDGARNVITNTICPDSDSTCEAGNNSTHELIVAVKRDDTDNKVMYSCSMFCPPSLSQTSGKITHESTIPLSF